MAGRELNGRDLRIDLAAERKGCVFFFSSPDHWHKLN